MVRAFDASGLIFTHRANDLIFQTAAIRLFMPPARRARFADFSRAGPRLLRSCVRCVCRTRARHRYQHHTMRHGRVNFGGFESGTADPDARANARKYAAAFGGAPKACDVATAADAAPERILLVLPDPRPAPRPARTTARCPSSNRKETTGSDEKHSRGFAPTGRICKKARHRSSSGEALGRA